MGGQKKGTSECCTYASNWVHRASWIPTLSSLKVDLVWGGLFDLGAIFGGFVIWFAWIEVAPLTTFLIEIFTSGMDPQNVIRLHLLDSVPYFRYLLMGMVLLLILRYRPKGIIPEKVRHS